MILTLVLAAAVLEVGHPGATPPLSHCKTRLYGLGS